jgi:glycosyltransferase involved in cell wall biosynthesis
LHAWGLQTEKYIFTACRFVPEKGVHDLVEAYRSIESPPFQLVVAGDADHESGYSRKLKMAASETEGVVLTGVVSGRTLAELYSNAGLFVLPSSFEGLPIALLEALSYGLPVLVSDILQQQEIRLGKSRYFKSGDIRDLAKSMMNAFLNGISDSEQKQNIALVEANNSWDDIAMKTDEIYREVL